MNQRTIVVTTSILGVFAVGLGAFGAHALKELLEATGRKETYELAVRYHFYHTIALLGVGILIDKFPGLKTSAIFFMAGIIIFSGSLYTLALTNQSMWGAVTPFGGLCLIVGWALTGWAVYKHRPHTA